MKSRGKTNHSCQYTSRAVLQNGKNLLSSHEAWFCLLSVCVHVYQVIAQNSSISPNFDLYAQTGLTRQQSISLHFLPHWEHSLTFLGVITLFLAFHCRLRCHVCLFLNKILLLFRSTLCSCTVITCFFHFIHFTINTASLPMSTYFSFSVSEMLLGSQLIPKVFLTASA